MNLYRFVRPVAFLLPPETAHHLIATGLKLAQNTPIESAMAARYVVTDSRLEVEAFDCQFPNPVGLGAGFDKNATFTSILGSLGFGHVEIGGVTAEGQPGNPRPRLFRLPEDQALINRMGFNNDGADEIGERLDRVTLPDVPLGVNLGKSKSTPLEEAPEDFAYTYERIAPHGDFYVVNVSSPNTPGLRELQEREHLESIVDALEDAGAETLLVKLSPDLSDQAIEDVLDLVESRDLAGVIATNTTTERPETLQNKNQAESGGLSGEPLEERATELVRFVAERTDKPVVGVGGVFTAEDAYRKIRAGASLIQLYTGMIYRGPAIARSINQGLLDLLEQDGFDSIEAAVGADLD